ncbi:hypothetical protein ACNKHT_10535 [Shigella flexneri]
MARAGAGRPGDGRGSVSRATGARPIALYCGFDPPLTACIWASCSIVMPKRFQQAGHKPVALVGGATGLIGDPSFKATERKLNTEETVQEWVDKIRKQVSPFLDFDCGENSASRRTTMTGSAI